MEKLLKLDNNEQAKTGLIQVVLPNISKGEEGYVYIGGLEGGMKEGESGKKRIAKRRNKKSTKSQTTPQSKTLPSFIPPFNSKIRTLLSKAQEGDRRAKRELVEFPWKKYLESKGNTKKAKKFLAQAIQWYKIAAKNNHKLAQEALISLRNEGLYSNSDEEVMGWYKQAVEAAIEGSELTFEEFQQRARDRFEKSKEEVEMKKKKRTDPKREPTWEPPMRLSDIIVMDLDFTKAPYRIEWGGNYTSPKEANADTIFGPLFEVSNSQRYEDAVMSIDPSGKGTDETAYCVAKRYGDYYFIIKVGGLAGKYDEKGTVDEDSKASVGNSPEVLKKLISIAMEHRVSRVIVENNNDKSFANLLEVTFFELNSKGNSPKELKFKVIKFDSVHQSENKETRIIKTLRPLLMEHRLIIDRKALKEDFVSEPKKNLYYKFFYQLMSIVKNKSMSDLYFDGLKPLHDDRVDAVADAIHYLQDRKNIADEFKLELARLKREAGEGNISSQLELGKRYKDGLGIEENYEEAIKWYKMVTHNKDAASKNRAEAVFNLAQIYHYHNNRIKIEVKEEQQKEKNKGKDKDNQNSSLEEVIKLYQEAAEQEHAGAKYELGKLYKKGVIQEKADERERKRKYFV